MILQDLSMDDHHFYYIIKFMKKTLVLGHIKIISFPDFYV